MCKCCMTMSHADPEFEEYVHLSPVAVFSDYYKDHYLFLHPECTLPIGTV